jgi:hypothetical protein
LCNLLFQSKSADELGLRPPVSLTNLADLFVQSVSADFDFCRFFEPRSGASEAREALTVIGVGRLTAAEIAERIKGEMCEIDPNVPVRVLDEVLANIVTEGNDYRRLQDSLQPILEFLGLEGRVRAVLFRSNVPIIALSPPNGLMISTRTLALLSDEELRAVVTHELCHLPLTEVFRAAVDAKDYRTMRIIELFCDAGGAAIMKARGENPRSLIKGLRRMQRVLGIECGERVVKGTHPTLEARARMNKQICRSMS